MKFFFAVFIAFLGAGLGSQALAQEAAAESVPMTQKAVMEPIDLMQASKGEAVADMQHSQPVQGASEAMIDANMMANSSMPAKPTSAWSIRPFIRDGGFPTNQCVMQVTYDNGMELVFKGREDRLAALRVQDTANQGRTVQGAVVLKVNNSNFPLQSRAKDGQIDSSLISVNRAADRIAKSGHFTLSIAGVDYAFAADDFYFHYQELLDCQGYKNVKPLPIVDEARGLPLPKKQRQLTSVVSDDSKNDINVITPDFKPITQESFPLNDNQWVAAQGRALSGVLNDWARRAGVNARIDLTHDPVLEATHIFDAGFEDAVQALLNITGNNFQMQMVGVQGKTGQADGQPERLSDLASSDMKKAQVANVSADGLSSEFSSTPTNLNPTHQNLNHQNAIRQKPNHQNSANQNPAHQNSINPNATTTSMTASSSRVVSNDMGAAEPQLWRALQGTNLRKVLERWSKKENVDFIWDADQVFFIRETVKAETDYQTAVAALISQFDGQNNRPQAQLNRDPETGRMALIISAVKS